MKPLLMLLGCGAAAAPAHLQIKMLDEKMTHRTTFTFAFLLFSFFLAPLAAQAQSATTIDQIDEARNEARYQEALTMLDEALQENPGDAELLWRRAQTYVDVGEEASGDRQEELYQKAVEDARAAVEAAPELANTHLSLAIAAGRVALNSGTKRKVELSRDIKEHVDQAIALDPDNDLAYHVRGRWNYGVADLGWFARAIVKTVYGGLPEASFEQAAADFEKALELDEKVVHHLELGRTLMKLDREQQAAQQFEQAIALEPFDSQDQRYQQEARELLEEAS